MPAKSGPSPTENLRARLLGDLADEKVPAVTSGKRRLLLIAGAGSGKTEVVARRIAWWVATGVPKESIVAFTFEERAAEEMKFRIRKYVEAITSPGRGHHPRWDVRWHDPRLLPADTSRTGPG